ncbi:MAG: substrate-binding domain-containing protein [Clostridia bacterium]|nr:substrate-binding domain-containing protein [Clostridia bacterium]
MSLKKSIHFEIVAIICLCIVISSIIFAVILKNKSSNKESADQPMPTKSIIQEEEYVWVSCIANQSMFVNHDHKALKQFGRDMGVRVTIEGPDEYDINAQAEAIRRVIKRRPAGLMVLGMERGLIKAVNEAVDAGIPTITVDADLVESKRMAHVGSNWFNIGVRQAEAMVKLIGGKGKVAAMGIGGADNMQQGFDGFKSVLKNYPDIVYLGEYDDMASVEESQRLTEEILKKHPDVAGIAGFDVNSGPGIGLAVKQAKKEGIVKVTCIDIEPVHLRLCKEGVIQKLIGQKRELFTYYGARLLYDFNHATISLSKDDKKNGITPIPFIIDTGLIEVDQSNVDSFLD